MDVLAPDDLVEEWSDLSASSLAPGAQLGRYELLLPIAYGGMARVWAARQRGQRGFSKAVAIKTILPHLAHNPEFEKMFLDEARIAAGVHHPNVTEIYELGEEGQVLYLAMEWVNGDSLSHVLRGPEGKGVKAIDPRIAARIVADACGGLHAAHELTDDDGRLLNVVHRDVSPHNILVSLEGTVKVTDFGVAKAYGQSHQATAAGQVKGKIAYMAPEQIGGTTFDRRADIFGMGCVLYEAMTGVQPFRGGNDPQVMQAILRGTYDPPVTLVKGFPIELTAIIDRALASEPRLRFATAERMRVALEEWLAKSGSLVTSTQVGSLVRQRLGAALDRRREHVKAAMATLHAADPTPQAGQAGQAGNVGMAPQPPRPQPSRPSLPGVSGHTPSRPQPGQSHSGVVTTGLPSASPAAPGAPGAPPQLPAVRDRAPSLPAVPPTQPLPPPTRLQGMSPQALVTGSQPKLPPPGAPASGARYLVAVIAGVAFALVVGGIALAVWLSMRSKEGEANVVPPESPSHAPSVVVAPPVAPPVASLPPAVASTVLAATTVEPAPSASAARPGQVAVPAPTTVNVRDLPTARPAWPTAPVMAPRPAPAAPASAPANVIPANPY